MEDESLKETAESAESAESAKDKILKIKIKCPKCGEEFEYGEIYKDFRRGLASVAGKIGGVIGGAAGRGSKKPSSAANLVKAREAAKSKISPERRREIMAKARAAKAAKAAAAGQGRGI